MGGDCGSWIPQRHLDWQSPNLRTFGALPNDGKQNGILAVMNSGINMATRKEAMPENGSLELPHLHIGHSGECNSWFYGLPRLHQAFIPSANLTAEEKLPAGHLKNYREEIQPIGKSGFPQKQFLVIDHSGDQTTFLYSSGFGNPPECLASWHSKRHGPDNLVGDEPSFRRDLNDLMGPTLTDKVDENHGTDVQSEMHEDTEEINALLYSDSDGCSTEDDEVTSTGHSPSTMTTAHNNQGLPRGGTEEVVASFTEKSRKRKLSDRAYDDDDDIQLMDTASSLKLSRPSDDNDDVESRCSSSGRNKSSGSGEMGGSLSGIKKMRKERIRDVLGILQSIIPDGKDKDPITLLDEAIRCLKSLKLKARALGLDVL